MKSILKVMAIGLAVTMAGVFAQDAAPASAEENAVSNDWNLKAGLSYRHLKRAKFNSQKTSAFTGYYMDGEGIQNLDDFMARHATARASIINVVNVPATGGYSKGDYGFVEELGLILGASYTLKEQDNLRLSLVGNFQKNSVDTCGHSSSVGYANARQYAMVLGNINSEALSKEFQVAVPGGGSRSKFDMDLYSLDLGAKLSYEFDNGLSLNVAAGPSLSLADMESSSSAAATVASAASTKHKNENEFEWGYYVSVGAEIWFTEKYGMNLDLRYDKAFGEVGTRYVSQNLDSLGGNICFLVRF